MRSFYRNLQCNIQAFDQYAMKITEYIVIGEIGMHIILHGWIMDECILDFIVSNGLHIINILPDNATSSIDITLCLSYILPLISNWRTDDVELGVRSDHLPITLNIKTTWPSPRIERQKIETWNLRQMEQFRLILKKILIIG
ncbi:hypothetical protein RFI_26752 [Reticulomyxa filosa]|uniref:Endonuclease/exonuclease/phosphatase domain-containing protein n=1 Tax=Reticulomyxa filosa TaxID=46433 RepID=X6MC49_RETFI|nr:hypothetical protein RFI_26752 [Reticulomyxa filosa]|eukprot:ETO10625.1 hypothetical protein RFI_26752 [Reticulomyxa filosa]